MPKHRSRDQKYTRGTKAPDANRAYEHSLNAQADLSPLWFAYEARYIQAKKVYFESGNEDHYNYNLLQQLCNVSSY